MNMLHTKELFLKESSITLWVLFFIIISVVGTMVTGVQAYQTSRDVTLQSAFGANLNLAHILKDHAAKQNGSKSEKQKLSDISQLWGSTKKAYDGSYLSLYDANGNTILDTAYTQNIGKNVSTRIVSEKTGMTIGSLLANKSDWVGIFRSDKGQKQLVAFSWLPELRSMVAVQVPYSSVEKQIRDTSLPWIIALVIMGAVLMPVLIWLLHHAYINSQNKLKDVNQSLNDEIHVRNQAEAALAEHRYQLEELVAIRTMALKSSNQELESFSYSVSHDLRSPLRSIDGFCNILLEEYEDNLDNVGRDYLRRIRNGVQHMGELIDDLLKLSRMNRAEMKQVPVDISLMSRLISDKLAEEDPSRKVQMEIESGIQMYADRNLIESVLANLIGNAWKYTSRQKKPRITISAEKNDEHSVLAIRDNGVGFDMCYADKLFGAFQRLHSAKDYPGTGIALATAHRIITRHGGRIWAESAPGQGATFRFSLPRQKQVQKFENLEGQMENYLPIVNMEKWRENRLTNPEKSCNETGS